VVFFEDDSMVKILSRIRSSLEFYDLKESFFSSEQYDFLIKIKAAVFVPIFSDQQLVCFMILPEKRGDKAYNYEELMLLNIFINEVSNVFMRNMIIEGVKRKEQEKARMERLASLGQLTATVAHEIRNPLNTISMSAETLLKRDLNKEDEQELLEYILEETGRLNRILTDFLRLSSVPEPHITEVDMEEFEQEVDRYIRTHLDCDIEYELVRSESFAKAYMDHNIVYEIILNLVGNAIDALCEQKQVEGRKLRVVFKQVKEYYIFAVEDNGRRIRPEEREKIFEPFYTTKPRGTGLGLSISVNLARVLSGELRLNIYQNKKRFILIIPKFDSNGKRV
jgi:signal transduction histidine kinase